MKRKCCKTIAWGLSLLSLLFYKLPVYASAGDPGDSAKRMFKMITVFALAAAAVIVIIIIIVQLRKGSGSGIVNEDSGSFVEKMERKREKKTQQYEQQNLQTPLSYPEPNSFVQPAPFPQAPVEQDNTVLKPMPSGESGYVPQPAIPYEQPVVSQEPQGVSIYSRSPRPEKVVLVDKKTQQKFQVPMADRIVIGRNSNMSQLVLKGDKAVSGKHCTLIYEMGQFYLEDLGSANGTYVNQKKIKGKIEIANGDELVMGRRKFEVQFL